MKENWEYIALGECFPTIKNGANIKQISGAMGFPITRIETLSGGVFNRDRMGYANITDLAQYCDYVLESGDLLLSHINSKAYIGRTVEYKKEGDEKIIHGMNLLRLRSNSNVINSTLFVYFTKSSCFKDAVARIRKDAVNQSSVAISDLRKIKVPVPPLDEQKKIVAELDLLSGVIDKQKAELRELDNLAQSTFYDMFGDPIENPKGWETRPLNEVAPQRPYEGTVPDVNGKYWLLNLDKVVSQSGDVLEKEMVDLNEIGNSVVAFDSTNVLYSKLRPYLNKVVIPNDFGYATSELVPLKPNRECLDRVFLTFLLRSKSFVNLISVRVAGAKMPRVSMDFLRNFEVILPPLDLQQSFADKIASIEKQKAALTQSIAETQKLLDYTMDKYFG